MEHKQKQLLKEDEERQPFIKKQEGTNALMPFRGKAKEQPGVKVTFNNLEYELELKVANNDSKSGKTEMKKTRIIKNASGYVLPGQTLFIMGATGAGKTTLLNMISDRTCMGKGATMRREVLINDSGPLDHTNFGSYAAYVMQDDILFNFFTCREALTFAARLKLRMSVAEQDERIEKLIQDFDLTEFADDQIGHVQGMMLTPSQVKRISIAESLIIDPAVLLLDEPTSGLDSIQALNLVKILRAQASKGKAVILTIHQPGSESFSNFDRLILMAEGAIVYQGEASGSTGYFRDIGYDVPPFTNPADYYMEVLQVTQGSDKDQKRIEHFQHQYQEKIAPTIRKEITNFKFEKSNNQIDRATAPWATQFKQLLYRNYVATMRDPRIMKAELVMTCFIGLLSLSCFWDLSGNDYATTLSLSGTLFFCSMTLFMMPFNTAIFIAIGERSLFMREQNQKMYSVFFYQTTKYIVELPILFTVPFIFTIIVFFGVGLTVTAYQFFEFYLILFLSTLCGYSFGYCFSCGFIKAETALTASMLPQIVIEQFGGYFVNAGSYPDWVYWLQYITPVRYSFEAMIRNEFETRDFADDESDPIDYLDLNIGKATCMVALAGMTCVTIVLALIILKRTSLTKIEY